MQSCCNSKGSLAAGRDLGTFAGMVRWRDYLLLLSAFLTVGTVLVVFVRAAAGRWWARPRWRRAAWTLLALDLAVPTAWFVLMRLGWTHEADGLVTVQLGLFFGQLALGGGLLLLVLWRAGARWRDRPAGDGVARPDRRRFLLQGAALALPAAAGAAGLGGVLESAGPVRLRRRTLRLPGLPPELSGLRILHFADVHLWHLVRLPDLQRALRRAPRGEYDLVCVTGDLADDMAQLPAALELIAGLAAPLGHFACLGNHEHARGLDQALAAYAAGPVELLRGGGTVLRHRGRPFVLAGIDDPRAAPRTSQRAFYADQVERAFAGAPDGHFRVLLSHRPSVLPQAARAEVDLVLAGHTHGGQLAIAGRSILQLYGAASWAWGVYRRGRTVMHVTCGMGQWFPFRLGCPPELVLLELRREATAPPV
jgi:uncharacterized protein